MGGSLADRCCSHASHHHGTSWDATTIVAILVLVFLTGGCIDISTHLQPEDLSVHAVLRGTDCVPIVLEFGFGTASIDKAMAGAHLIGASGGHVIRITKVSRVTLTDSAIVFIAERCIEVVGE